MKVTPAMISYIKRVRQPHVDHPWGCFCCFLLDTHSHVCCQQ